MSGANQKILGGYLTRAMQPTRATRQRQQRQYHVISFYLQSRRSCLIIKKILWLSNAIRLVS